MNVKLTILALITTFAVPALADTPNRTKMTFAEFAGASGCVIRDNAAGQSNAYAIDGGNCPVNVAAAFANAGTGTAIHIDTDGDNVADVTEWVNDEN